MPFILFQNQYFAGGAATSQGLVRKENQDSYCCINASGLFAVSDGMGGGEGGDRASAMVIRSLGFAAHRPMKDLSGVVNLIHRANQEIHEYASKYHMRGMGATVVGILLAPFQPENAILFFAGDSRCFRFRNGSLEQLSTDHTVASAMGIPEEKLARHLQGVLTNAVGCGPNFFLETQNLNLASGDSFLLCSDGVSRQVPESEIREIMASDLTPPKKAQKLVDASLNYGGKDNATAVVISFGSLPEISPEVRKEESESSDSTDFEEIEHVTPPTE